MNQWTPHTEEYQALLQDVKRLAGQNGYIINPDLERVEKVVGLMTENLVTAGKRYCPCKQSHPLDPQTDVTCPCPPWKGEIRKDGHCFCRLFYETPA